MFGAKVPLRPAQMLGGRVVVKPKPNGNAHLALNLDLAPLVSANPAGRYKLVAGACFETSEPWRLEFR
jgi:hypothetical protein